MTKSIEITLPKLGESIVSATVVRWFKKEGDEVRLDEPLLEVSTDKVNSEIPSPISGVIEKILVDPDQEVEVGAPLLRIATEGEATEKKETPAPESTSACTDANDVLSPSVLRLLQEKGISLSEVDKIPRSGQGGRLTKKDVEAFAAKAPAQPSMHTERVKMSAMRKAIADNMVKSFYEAPHASLITEVDVTDVLKEIQENKESFFKRTKAKLTISAFAARAIARALKTYPLLNASLEGDTIVMKRFVHLGIAVSVDQGVMVPVLKDCQKKGLEEIAREIALLAEKTRNSSLSPDELKEGTITMTNFGMTGTMIGVPIIRYPEVAIVGLGAITKKVCAMPDDAIAVRNVMFVSLTFDHRVLDGIYGCGFLRELKNHLEKDTSL